MNTSKLAMQVATENNLKGCAYKYDLFLREYDNKVELLGLVDDPTVNFEDFREREMLIPKKLVTLKVLSAKYKVRV